jgi:GTP-binding protein
MLAVQKAIKEHGVDGTVQTFSSLSGDGVDDLRIKLAEWLVLDNLEGIPVSPNA